MKIEPLHFRETHRFSGKLWMASGILCMLCGLFGESMAALVVYIISIMAAAIISILYSSSVKRVLITRLRWGVLYLFMAVNLLSWVDFFKRRKPQKAGLGWQPQQDSHRTK